MLPSSTAELDIIVGTSKELTVGNEGVVTNYLRFNSVELQNLRRSIGLKFRTMAKFNPEDLSSAFVQDPVSQGWLTVPSCHPEYTDGLSLVQHKAIRSLLKGGLSRRQIPQELERAKWQLADIWAAGATHGKKLQAAHLRAMAGLTSSHAINGISPQRPAAPALEAPAKVLIESDLKMPEWEIPSFDSFDLVAA
jgi:putative transposase